MLSVDHRAGAFEDVEGAVAEALHADLGQDPERRLVDGLDLVVGQDPERFERVDEPAERQSLDARSGATGSPMAAGGFSLGRGVHRRMLRRAALLTRANR